MSAKIFYYILIASYSVKTILAVTEYNTNSNNNGRHHNSRSSTNRTLAVSENYCQKLYDRVSSLQSLNEQQIRELATIQSRLTRMEDSNHEQLNSIHNDVKEISQKAGNLDIDGTKSEAALRHLRKEIDSMRQYLDDSQSQLRLVRSRNDGQQLGYSEEGKENVTSMLASLATFLTSVRQGVFNVEANVQSLQTNISSLLHISRELQKKQRSQPSKQYINHAIGNVRSQLCGINNVNDQNLHSSFGATTPLSCLDEQIKDNQVNKIQVNPFGSFYVRCFASTEYGRGWTMIMNRFDGSFNFYRPWVEYKNGFGNIAGEFFIGLEKLHALTSNRLHELLILLQDFNNGFKFAKYKAFAIGNESEDYALNILGKHEGTAGDALTYSAGYKFSTFDNDNDGWVEGNCAQSHTGAWWYNACEMTNLMGQYLRGEVDSQNMFQGMYWNDFRGSNYSLYAATMLIRPIDEDE